MFRVGKRPHLTVYCFIIKSLSGDQLYFSLFSDLSESRPLPGVNFRHKKNTKKTKKKPFIDNFPNTRMINLI